MVHFGKENETKIKYGRVAHPWKRMENEKNEIFRLKDLAERLNKIEEKQNQGRGVSCVRSVVLYLQRGDEQSAKAICNNEGDKIRNYPEIARLLEKELVGENFFGI